MKILTNWEISVRISESIYSIGLASQSVKNKDNVDSQDLDDWSQKYDATLTALSQEYYEYINLIRQVDEKANKYLVILSIFVAGFFTIIGGSLTDKLVFGIDSLCKGTGILSWLFIIYIIICGGVGFCVFKDFLNTLAFADSVRLPNLKEELGITGSSNYVEYKYQIIQYYQDAIGKLNKVREEKQKKLCQATDRIPSLLICMTLSVTFLFFIKIVGR